MSNKINLKKVNSYIWLLDFEGDYFLDETLESGKKGIIGLVKFLQKKVKHEIGVPKIYREGGCTTFNIKGKNGDYLFGRNFDYKMGPCLVTWTKPAKGYKSLAICNMNFMLYGFKLDDLDKIDNPKRLIAAPYTAMDGINEEGLSAAILEIKSKSTKQETGKTPITTIVAFRAILDKCKTVDEAIELLKQYDMHDLLFISYHYHITDRFGNSAVVEYVDNEISVIRKEENGKSTISSNFFLTPGGDNRKEMGRLRYNKVLENISKVNDEKTIMNLLANATVSYRHKWLRHHVGTLWSAVYNNTKLEMSLCAGEDYQYMYQFSLNKPMKYKTVEVNIESNPILEGIGSMNPEKTSFIKLENVVKTYGENENITYALNNVNLEIEKGKILAILGSSGSGKSTLLNIISGMDKPNSGCLYFKNQNISTLNDKNLTNYRKDNIGFVFQSFNLINELTVYENIELTASRKENENIIEESLEAVGLLEKKDKYPYELSGGEQQRVSIARALAKNTDILLCDEPTGALDYQTGKQILIELEKLNKKYQKTIIIVTHTREIGKMAHRVVTTKNGTIIDNFVNKNIINAIDIEW